MKAFLVVFILLASVIILPSSTTARELVSKEENSRHKHGDISNNGIVTDATTGGPVTGGSGNRNKPVVGNCPRGKRYSTCLQPPKPPCKPYERNCH